jgi:hydroxypyruvate isomerase
MMQWSANLGFLWTDRSLPEAIWAAHKAGFDAVECHWPYDYKPQELKDMLDQTGLPMLGLNMRRGDLSAGENGLAAVPGREEEARSYIDESLVYASAIGCKNIHVMAGFTEQSDAAEKTFQANLSYAAQKAEISDQTILIEPLNHRDAPSYHLQSVEAAEKTIKAVGSDRVKIMFDFYHIQVLQGDVLSRFKAHLPFIGHVQIASVPERAEPNLGELNYVNIISSLYELGYEGYIGAEYKPQSDTDSGLDWLKSFQ